MRAFVRQLRKSWATDRAVIAEGRVENRRGRGLLSEGPAPDHEVRKPAGCDHRARMPARLWYRHARAPPPGAGPGRIRDARAGSRCALDREPDRPSAAHRSGTAGRDAGVLAPDGPRVPYRSQFGVLTDLPARKH